MESRMIKIAGRCAAFAAACLAFCSAHAANRYWTGAGGDNEWTNKLNWSGSAWPGTGDTAIFTNDAPLGVRLNPATDYQDRCAQNLKFLGKDVAFGSDGYANKVLYFFGNPTTTIEVVSGTTVTMSNRMYRYNANLKVLAKTGGGKFRYIGCPSHTVDISNVPEWVIHEGEMGGELLPGYSYGVYMHSATTNVIVKSGATLFMVGYNAWNNSETQDVFLEKGATFRVDTCGSVDTLGRISGEGSIVAYPSKSAHLRMTFGTGPCDFSGMASNNVKLTLLDKSGVPSANKKFVLGSSDGLALATLVDAAGALRFAPGVGDFSIGTYTPTLFKTLLLEDEAGEPVSLTAKFSSTTNCLFAGAGSLHITGADATFTNHQMQIGGDLSINGKAMTFGDGTAAADADLSTISSLKTTSGTLAFKNVGATVLDVPVEGNGTIRAYGPVSFSDFRMKNTQIEPSASATVTLAGGSSTLSAFTFAEANATIEVTGGTHTGKKTLRTLDTASILPVPSFVPTAHAPGILRVSGGEVWLSNELGYLNRLELLGGKCVMNTGYAPNSAATAENPSVILFDGGTMTINMRDVQYWWWMPNSASSTLAIKVGANGARFDTLDRIGYTSDSADAAFYRGMSTADGVACRRRSDVRPQKGRVHRCSPGAFSHQRSCDIYGRQGVDVQVRRLVVSASRRLSLVLRNGRFHARLQPDLLSQGFLRRRPAGEHSATCVRGRLEVPGARSRLDPVQDRLRQAAAARDSWC